MASPASLSTSAITNSGAFFDKALGDALADSARRADHESALAFKSSGHASFCLIASFTVSSRSAASTNAPSIICV